MKLRERNLAVIKKVLTGSEEIVNFRESFKKHRGIDPFDQEKFPVLKEGFSWKALRTKLASKFSEADVSSAYAQFLRAGIQNIVNAAYETVETTFEDWTTTVQSTKDTELYAPLHGLSFPRQVGPSEKYPELRSAALDIKLKNYKYGSMYSVEHELLEDDQTGQFARQAGLMGEYIKLLTEVLVYGKLASISGMKYLDYEIPVSETKPADETNYPWSTALQGGGSNRPGTYLAFNQSNIQTGYSALMGQKNLLGQLMQVSPNRILISPKFVWDAQVLLNSTYYPTGATPGATGGAFAINPLKSIADLSVSRYMFDNTGVVNPLSKAWYLIDDSKRGWFVCQIREVATVLQENPQSGASFEYDNMRFKVRARMNADFIDPRFAWRGNDGSI